jgi:ComF family protein
MQRHIQAVLDMVFPRNIAIARYDALDASCIARTASVTVVNVPFPCLAPFPYDHKLVRGAIRATKYHAHERAAALLGEALAPFVAEEVSERRMFGSFTNALLVPIPLHPQRLRDRGFNQAERIAQSLNAHIGETLVLSPDLLVRVHNTATQTKQTRKQRLMNMRGSFAVAPRAPVAGADIVLLDDVVTTGATMGAARDALRAAGAREVLCVAVAH